MMPQGTELDAAVAKAMGLSQPAPRAFWRDAEGNIVPDPFYSTDVARIPEMLAWLNERGWFVSLWQSQVTRLWEGKVWSAPHGSIVECDCQTIQHALANLVVAVAARGAATEGA